jgi:hypothetical protein
MSELAEKIKTVNIRTDSTRARHGDTDDRYWHPRQELITSTMAELPEGKYEEVFGYSYRVNGKYYDHNWKEVKRVQKEKDQKRS